MRRPRRIIPRPGVGGAPTSTAAIATGALIGVVLLAGLAVLGLTSQNGLPGRHYYRLTADFDNAKSLGRYSEVRIAGKRVGQVIAVTERGGRAQVRLQLDSSAGPLPADTTARIRLKGLLGAKFVELRPGHDRSMMPGGATIPARQTSSTVELFDVIESFDKPTRAGLRATLRGLGGGFAGRGEDLNGSLRRSPAVLSQVSRISQAVLARPGAAERFFPSADSASEAFEPVREELAQGFDPQARALAPFDDRRAGVQQTLEAAPGALAALRQGLARNDPLLVETARLARATSQLTKPAPAALRATAALLRDSRRPLADARTLLTRTGTAVHPTLQLTGRLDPLIPPLRKLVDNQRPLLDALGPYRCDFLGYVRNWRSMLGWGIPSNNPIGIQTGLRSTIIANEHTVAGIPARGTKQTTYGPPCQLGPVTVP